MKLIFSLLTGMAFVLTFGSAYAEGNMTGREDTGDRMIRNEDLPYIILDPNRATVNQMPAETGAEGSAAGGVSEESGGMYKDSDQGNAPVEKAPAETGVEGTGTGGVGKDSDAMKSDSDQSKAPAESTPEPPKEGSSGGMSAPRSRY